MNDIYIFRNGQTTPAKIEQLFVTHGPYTIEGNRLDLLTKAQIIVDSSTSQISQVGTSSSSANTGSMLGRAVVGGILTGGVGAVIGGLSGTKDSTINTVSSESKNTELTTELTFEDGSSLYVLIKSMDSFHWLLGFAGQRACSEGEIETFRKQALDSKYEEQLLAAHKKAISLIEVPIFGNKDVINKAKTKVQEETFKILQSTPDVSRDLVYDEFVNIYENAVTKSKIINSSKAVEKSDKFSIYILFKWIFGILLILTILGVLTSGSQWYYSQNEEKISSGNSYNAIVLSSNQVDFKFPYNGVQNATLHLRSSSKLGKHLIFSLEKGRILCNTSDGCSLLVRFDNEKATDYLASASADKSDGIIFINDYSKFVEKMMKAKRVYISTNIYQQGTPVFEFDISGFDNDKYNPKN